MDSKTINKEIHKNKYQMHNIECLMDNIAQSITQSSNEGQILFSTIDLRYAYSRLPLDEDTANQCNFNIIGVQATGTYRFNTGFNRLTDMPAEFQKAIDKTIFNLKNTFSYLDDIIIVTGGGLENHKKHLFNCLDRLNNENLAINLDKCHFAKSKITWLGHEITEKGIKPVISKTQAIINLKPPTTHKQFKSFLCSVHHLTKFIPNLATPCRGFRDLLQKDTKYVWTENHQSDFETIKNNIKNLTENNHYDIKRNTRVKTDASRSGLGAVLEQETCNGWETISYASRFLNKADEKCSINELQLLGVVWALEHFKNYLLGHHFIVQTDHRALLSILKERNSKIHQGRLTRWYDRLIPFNFNIEHIPGTKMGFADYMSRNPSEPAKPPNEYDENFIIATIDIIRETLNKLRNRDRHRKQQIQQATNNQTKTSNDSTLNKNNRIKTSNDSKLNKKNNTESLNDSTHTNINNKHTRQRGRPRKAIKELQNSYKESQDTSQKHVTKTIKPYTVSNHNCAQNSNNTDLNTANYDVRTNQQFAHNTIPQAHLPFISPNTQQPHLITLKNSVQQMDNPANVQTNPTTGSTSPKKAFSMTSYLSPPPKQPTIGTTSEKEEQLPKPPDDIFNTKLITPMTNRDTVLREVRDCILTMNNDARSSANKSTPSGGV